MHLLPRRIFKSLRARLLHLLRGDPNKFLRGVRGVIHVGANAGQERDLYRRYGLHVLWIEPIPHVFDTLAANIRDYDNQSAIQALVTDVDDQLYEFHLASNGGQSSSILELQEHRDVWPDVVYTETLQLRSTTLPTLLKTHSVDVTHYDTLILDTQGSELLVLRGAEPILHCFRFIKVEVPDFEAYRGCCQVSDIEDLLRPRGFTEIKRTKFAEHPEAGSYFDIVYEAKGP